MIKHITRDSLAVEQLLLACNKW